MKAIDLKAIKREVKKVEKKRKKKGLPATEEPTNFQTVEAPKIQEEVVHTVQVAFFTKQQQYAVPEVSISIPDSSRPKDLNILLHKMLESSCLEGTPPLFDFLIDGKMLSGKLMHKIDESEVLSREVTIPIEYLEIQPPPEKKDSLKHDDWVACLHYGRNDLLITGCYDNTIHIWRPSMPGGAEYKAASMSDQPQAHLLKISEAHLAPVKVISWLPNSQNRFISGGVDQLVRMWKYDPATNAAHCTHVCRGHKIMVQSLALTPDGKMFATGDGYGSIKLWTTDDKNLIDAKNPAKKSKSGDKKPKAKGPSATLASHSQSVNGLVFSTLNTLVSCSADNSVRLWDIEKEVKTQDHVAPSPCVAMDSSPFNNALLVTTTDFRVRLVDFREDGKLDLVRVYEHHLQRASCVKWSPFNDKHFVTGGYDKFVKLWDLRSPRVPLYEMKDHQDKVLGLDWSSAKTIFSAGADTNVHMFSVYSHNKSS